MNITKFEKLDYRENYMWFSQKYKLIMLNAIVMYERSGLWYPIVLLESIPTSSPRNELFSQTVVVETNGRIHNSLSFFFSARRILQFKNHAFCADFPVTYFWNKAKRPRFPLLLISNQKSLCSNLHYAVALSCSSCVLVCMPKNHDIFLVWLFR